MPLPLRRVLLGCMRIGAFSALAFVVLVIGGALLAPIPWSQGSIDRPQFLILAFPVNDTVQMTSPSPDEHGRPLDQAIVCELGEFEESDPVPLFRSAEELSVQRSGLTLEMAEPRRSELLSRLPERQRWIRSVSVSKSPQGAMVVTIDSAPYDDTRWKQTYEVSAGTARPIEWLHVELFAYGSQFLLILMIAAPTSVLGGGLIEWWAPWRRTKQP